MRPYTIPQFIIVTFIFILLTSATSIAKADENVPLLRFSNKHIDPLKTFPMTPETPVQRRVKSRTRKTQTTQSYFIVQFDSPIQKSWKQTILDMGATFFDYIPEYAFIIKVDTTKESAIRDIIHVRWVGPYNPEFKFSDQLLAATQDNIETNNDKHKIRVVAFPGEDIPALEQQIKTLGGEVQTVSESAWNITFVVLITRQKAKDLANISGIKWIEPVSKNQLHNNIGSKIVGTLGIRDKVWPNSHSKLFGNGQTVAICDSGIDTCNPATVHKDFFNSDDGSGLSRVTSEILTGASPPDTNGHGTHVAGTVAGNGLKSGSTPSSSTFPDTCYAGIAPKAKIYFQTAGGGAVDGDMHLPADLNDLFQSAYDNSARVHTNSWGGPSVGSYDGQAVNVDQFTWAHKDFLILFAAGNSGTDKDRNGVIDMYSLATPCTAKNCLTIGASESLRSTGGYAQDTWGGMNPIDYGAEPISSDLTSNNTNGMSAFSSRGPTLDGRYKPEIVAPGSNILSTRSSSQTGNGWGEFNEYYYYSGGTSMATPIVAGTSILLREYLINEEQILNPSASLMKAALINGAVNMYPGQYGTGTTQEILTTPDTSQGWGRLNLGGSLNTDTNFHIDYHEISGPLTGETDYKKSYTFTIADKGKPYRATMSWTDYPGTELAQGGLVNDLDLRVKKPNGDWVYPDNAKNLSSIERVKYFVNDDDGYYTNSKFALRVTPSSYPSYLENVYIIFSNQPLVEGPIDIVVYSWTGTEIGEELYRKKYSFLKHGQNIVPIGYTVSSGSVVISIEKQDSSDCGVFYSFNNPTGRSFVTSGDNWNPAPNTPSIEAIFRSQIAADEYDRINNTVSVTIDTPEIGTYTAEVTAHNIPQGPQPYALVINGLTSTIPVSGNESIKADPTQPNAPTYVISSTERKTKTTLQIAQDSGVFLDNVCGDVVEFTCSITSGTNDLISIRYGTNELPAVSASTLSLKKLLDNGLSLSFNYPDLKKYEDGNWWLTDTAGRFISPTTILDPETTYYILSVIKDNGPYDLNSAVNVITDPQVITAQITTSSNTSSTNNSGCTIGSEADWMTTLLAIIAVCGLFFRRKQICVKHEFNN